MMIRADSQLIPRGCITMLQADPGGVATGDRREGPLMSVAAILKFKGSHVETTPPATTLYSAVWVLKSKNLGAHVVGGWGQRRPPRHDLGA